MTWLQSYMQMITLCRFSAGSGLLNVERHHPMAWNLAYQDGLGWRHDGIVFVCQLVIGWLKMQDRSVERPAGGARSNPIMFQ
jgi:hypothetical protein